MDVDAGVGVDGEAVGHGNDYGDEDDGGEYGVGVNAEVASRVQEEEDVLVPGAHSVVSSKGAKDH